MKVVLSETRIILIMAVLGIIFFGINYYLILNIKAIQGTARVINYTGIVRGGTQRLIKKELAHIPDDGLLGNLDKIVQELQKGAGPNDLILLPDRMFLSSMDAVDLQWQDLKAKIMDFRQEGDPKFLFDASEFYFQLVNQTVSLAEDFSRRQVSQSIFQLVCINGVFFLVIVLVLLYYNSINKRIRRVGLMVKDISESEGDLTKRLNIHANNEVGIIVQYFDATLDQITDLVIIIKEHSATLSQTGTKLMENMTQSAATVSEITHRIKKVLTQTNQQSGGITRTNQAMQDIIARIESLNEHIETQAANIGQSSTAIEKLLDNIASVTQRLVKNNENVEKLAQASDAGRTGLQEVSSNIQTISRESEGLLEITQVMENIASQTNLLSMNAAIEAAHAGESGKGFAVVAEEIRKLAESSSEQSGIIAQILKKIKESIDSIANSTNGVINRFEAIDQNVKIVAEEEEQVRVSMEEQGAGSQQILEHIQRLKDITETIGEESGNMRTGSRDIFNESKTLESITKEIMGSVQVMSREVDQINSTIQEVTAISDENKKHIDVLDAEISKFKVSES